MAPLQILYRFNIDGGACSTFRISLDPVTLALQTPRHRDLPDWTRLEHHQCPDCPLHDTGGTTCPMAEALVDLQDFAGHLDSYSPLTVSVTTPEREIHTAVPAQRAVSSLMGLLIATCACPDVAWLRPMARFHLPLASEEETIYRATSMYLLAQYFRHKSGVEPDLSLQGLGQRYHRLHAINVAMAARLREAVAKDAPVNAVVLLDLFAKAMPYSVADSVAELEYLFRPYLD
jgi:hypothetical protein